MYKINVFARFWHDRNKAIRIIAWTDVRETAVYGIILENVRYVTESPHWWEWAQKEEIYASRGFFGQNGKDVG